MNRARPDGIADYLQRMLDAIDRAILHTQTLQPREEFDKHQWQVMPSCVALKSSVKRRLRSPDPTLRTQIVEFLSSLR